MFFLCDREKARGVSRWGWRAEGGGDGAPTSPSRVSDAHLESGLLFLRVRYAASPAALNTLVDQSGLRVLAVSHSRSLP